MSDDDRPRRRCRPFGRFDADGSRARIPRARVYFRTHAAKHSSGFLARATYVFSETQLPRRFRRLRRNCADAAGREYYYIVRRDHRLESVGLVWCVWQKKKKPKKN